MKNIVVNFQKGKNPPLLSWSKWVKLFLPLLVLIGAFNTSLAQTNLTVKPYVGYNKPLGNFRDFAQNGYDFGLSIDYLFSKNFGFGFDFNQQNNNPKNPFDFSVIPYNPGLYTVSNTQSGKWQATTFGFGPVYYYAVFSPNFGTELYIKPGVSFVKIPKYQTTFNYQGISRDLFNLNQHSVSTFGLTTGIRFNYKIGNNTKIFVNPQHVYTAAKVNYTYREVNNAFRVDQNGQVQFNPGLLVEQPAIEKQFNVSYFNLNLGISHNFGKSNAASNLSEKKTDCRAANLKSPPDQKNYYLSEKERPDFEWNDDNRNTPKFYVLKIVDDKNNLIYSTQTKKQSVKHNRELESVYQAHFNEKGKTLGWKVESHFDECGILESETQYIQGYTRSVGLVADLLEVECKPAAFDTLGFVHYYGRVCLKNAGTTNIVIPSQTFYAKDPTGTNPDQVANPVSRNIGGLLTPVPVLPITLIPGQNICFWVEFKRPIGEQNTEFYLNYQQQNSATVLNEIAPAKLPSCICNVCKGWKIVSTNEKFWQLNTSKTNMKIRTDFQLLNANPIKEIKAEIISVEHNVNDEQCRTCTKHDEQMGLFYNGYGSGRIYSSNGWQNSGQAQNSDGSNDNYFNEFTWVAQTSQGVDMSVLPAKMIMMNLNLPQLSKLECCTGTYTVCIRYTFTDINCQTCDTVICYEYKSNQNSGNGTGTGQDGGLDTDVSQNEKDEVLTPKKLKK
ncbi:MAG: hypothetical protein H6607_01065 [Flavobacteriales bacterium]|nr:hypothetical protein [Flavobacteriales bacterium]